jgi:hypothetical protein
LVDAFFEGGEEGYWVFDLATGASDVDEFEKVEGLVAAGDFGSESFVVAFFVAAFVASLEVEWSGHGEIWLGFALVLGGFFAGGFSDFCC